MSPFGEYERKKRALLEDFQKQRASSSTFSLDKKTSNLFRNRNTSSSKKLNVKQFNQVLSIDPLAKVAEVEAMITYEELVEATLKYNCLPPVVPELKTITIGGALVGLGIESSSFRYGLVHETILEIEVLTGEGRILTCRPDNEHRDLFYAFPNSYGTLGYALKIKLRLIPAKPFVRLTNTPFSDPTLFFQTLKDLCLKNPTDAYIDGVIFSPTQMILIRGEFDDNAPFTNNYTYLKSYYRSLQKKETNYLTAHDYIWRWDADWFWCSKHFGMHNPLLRLLLGKFMLHSAVYWKIMRLASSNPLLKTLVKFFEKPSESVIQDILIPIENAPQFYQFFQRSIGITPIWICPSYNKGQDYSLCPLAPETLYIDFGFWDIVPSSHPKGHLNRLIEQKTKELKGFKGLYSDSYYTEEEFWQIHPKHSFSQLKAKYDPQKAFKDLYDKCVQRN